MTSCLAKLPHASAQLSRLMPPCSYKGFLVYLVAHALGSGLLALKAGGQPQRYFPSR